MNVTKDDVERAIRERRTHTEDYLVLVRDGHITVREDARIDFEGVVFSAGMRLRDEHYDDDDPALSPDAASWTPEDNGKDAANGTP